MIHTWKYYCRRFHILDRRNRIGPTPATAGGPSTHSVIDVIDSNGDNREEGPKPATAKVGPSTHSAIDAIDSNGDNRQCGGKWPEVTSKAKKMNEGARVQVTVIDLPGMIA